jgi:hypothetical protein
MARWRWEGAFSIDVPDGWDVNDFSDGVEVVPPDPSGAAHFSTYKRVPPRPVEPGEASGWLCGFADQQLGVPVDDPPEIAAPLGREARLACVQQTNEGPRPWEIAVQVWPERAVFFTYNHDGSRPDHRDAALTMFASVEPDRGR